MLDYRPLESPLYEALMTDDVDALRTAIQEDPNVQINKFCSIPPLHLACLLGEIDCVKVLLQHEADLFAEDMIGAIPFHYACESGNAGLVKYFTDEYAKVDPDTVRNMLDAHDSIGNAPLHYAAMTSSPELVAHLLALGACSLEENANEMHNVGVIVVLRTLTSRLMAV
ncbi:hypothetical protein OROHE_009617 [Orobanche hederae]